MLQSEQTGGGGEVELGQWVGGEKEKQEGKEIKTGGGLGIWGLGAEDVTEERRGRDRMANRSGSSGEAGWVNWSHSLQWSATVIYLSECCHLSLFNPGQETKLWEENETVRRWVSIEAAGGRIVQQLSQAFD